MLVNYKVESIGNLVFYLQGVLMVRTICRTKLFNNLTTESHAE